MPLPDPVSRMNIGSYLPTSFSHLKVCCAIYCQFVCRFARCCLSRLCWQPKYTLSLVEAVHTTSLGLLALYRGFCFPSLQLYISFTVVSMLFGLRLEGMGVVMSCYDNTAAELRLTICVRASPPPIEVIYCSRHNARFRLIYVFNLINKSESFYSCLAVLLSLLSTLHYPTL